MGLFAPEIRVVHKNTLIVDLLYMIASFEGDSLFLNIVLISS